MANSNGLTVSKLSKLQKLILKKIRDNDGWYALLSLAWDVADEYEGIERQRVQNMEFDDWIPREVQEELGGVLAVSYQAFLKHKKAPYFTIGEKGGYILSNKFKASFYRSIKRLVKRGLIKYRYSYYDNEFTGRRVHFKGVSLTDKFTTFT